MAVTVEELAKTLNCHPDTIYRKANSGDIPGFKLGSEWRFFPSAVMEALTAKKDTWAQPTRSIRRRRAA